MKINNKRTYEFGFRHYWNYFKINLILSSKGLVEYKVNLFNSIFIQIFIILMPLLFGFVIIENFGNIIKWNYIDFLVFHFFQDIIFILSGHFYWGKQIENNIIRGDFNKYLYRPGIPFFSFILHREFSVLPFLIFDLIFLFPLILYFANYSIFSIFASIIFTLFIVLLFVIGFFALDSISFLSLKLGSVLSEKYYEEVSNSLRFTPSVFFINSNFKYFLMLVPMFYIASFIVPLFQNKEILYLVEQILALILLLIINFLAVYFLWKIGLKKYEAFG